jgi:hypothetical protein
MTYSEAVKFAERHALPIAAIYAERTIWRNGSPKITYAINWPR